MNADILPDNRLEILKRIGNPIHPGRQGEQTIIPGSVGRAGSLAQELWAGRFHRNQRQNLPFFIDNLAGYFSAVCRLSEQHSRK